MTSEKETFFQNMEQCYKRAKQWLVYRDLEWKRRKISQEYKKSESKRRT